MNARKYVSCVDEKNVLLTAGAGGTCNDFFFSICCLDENNSCFNEMEVGYRLGIFAY